MVCEGGVVTAAVFCMENQTYIKYLRFRLPLEGTLVEPDVEIPLDEYRSYSREKRSSLEVSK